MSNDTVFYKIYLASRQSISRVISRIVPPDEIEDIVQETYVRICQVENKENIDSPKSFMFKTAKNLALDYQKQASVRLVDRVDNTQDLELLLSDTNNDEMYQQAVSHHEFSNFCDAVRHLPIQCRKVFVLKKVYGYSQKEIAVQLNISESTVEKHISTGVKRCTIFMRKMKNVSSNRTSRDQSSVGGCHE